MFVALEIAESYDAGIFGGILNILKKPRPRMEVREVYGAEYGVLIAVKPVSASDWGRIAAAVGRYGDTMLFPDDIVPPAPLCEAKCPRFERRLILGTAIEIIKRTRMPMYRRIVGLVDENGEYADFLFKLLHHFTTVKVLSKRRELYEAQRNLMMEELGAPVIICDDYASFSDCVLIIAPNGVNTADKLASPVLGKPGKAQQTGDFITNLRFVPSAEQIKLCPKGIEPYKFFAVLYEYCGVKDIGNVASRMNYRNAEADLAQVVHAVMKSAGILSIF